MIWKHCPHTLRSVLRYVPDALSSLARRRFLFYQLLVAVRTAHRYGVTWSNSSAALCPQTCMLTERLWLRLRLPLTAIPKSVESLDRRTTTQKWIEGDLSNFEYLLIVNAAAGRVAGPSANLHPILPWVRCVRAYHSYHRKITLIEHNRYTTLTTSRKAIDIYDEQSFVLRKEMTCSSTCTTRWVITSRNFRSPILSTTCI